MALAKVFHRNAVILSQKHLSFAVSSQKRGLASLTVIDGDFGVFHLGVFGLQIQRQ